jgi:putative transposase
VLNKLPRGQQVSAKNILHEIWMSATREDAIKAMEKFAATYQAKYPKAVECLMKDKEELLAFYDFPAEHWQHLRTSNPIESTFATVRLRTSKTKEPAVAWPVWRWHSNWSSQLRTTGENSTAARCCPPWWQE